MADVSTHSEGVAARLLGADIISTTLSGYTQFSPENSDKPDFELLESLVKSVDCPVFLEGRIWTPEQVDKAFGAGRTCSRYWLCNHPSAADYEEIYIQRCTVKKALGIDIGGTKLVYAIIGENGEFLSEIRKIPTPSTSEAIFEQLKALSKEFENEIDAVAIATAGAVNRENTRVCSSTPNLPEGYNSLDFSELSDKKVFVENDANAAAWAEYKLGAAKGCDFSLIITLGTGIGAGVVNEGKLIRGKSGAALEAGSMKIFADKRRKCTCIAMTAGNHTLPAPVCGEMRRKWPFQSPNLKQVY